MQKMKRFKHIINEVQGLEKFQVYTDLIKFLNTEFGLLADIEIFMNYIDIYVSTLRDQNTDISNIKEDEVSKRIKKFFNSKDYNKKAEAVWVTEYGYAIVLETDADIFEEKMLQENALYYYYYSDTLDTDDTNNNVFMAHGKSIKSLVESQNKESIDDILEDNKEAIEDEVKDDETQSKDQVHADTSNIILDKKFVWFFNVLDSDENIIMDDITELEAAIDTLIEEGAQIIVALPYTDTNPADDNADLVFAEEPGPIIIYDGR